MSRTLITVLLFATGILPTYGLAALERCGFEFAAVEEWIWPVFLHDPGKAGEMEIPSVDVLIDRQGRPVTIIQNNRIPNGEFDFLKRIVPAMVFSPGNSCEEPIDSYIRCEFSEYFLQITPKPATSGLFPPIPMWRISSETLHRLEYYGRTYERELAIVDFFIDAEGNLKKTRGRNDYGSNLSKYLYNPEKENLKFKPATVAGVPVESRIRLFFGRDKTLGKPIQYRDNAREPYHLLLPWPTEVPLEDLFTVLAELKVDLEGNVTEIQLLSQMPPPVSRQLVQDLRMWRLDKSDFKIQKDHQTVQLELAFDPMDRSASVLKVSLLQKNFSMPEPVKRKAPSYPARQSESGNSGIAVIKFVVTTSGDVDRITDEFSSHPDFAEAAKKAIKDWKFKPAKYNGDDVACWVRVEIPFHIR